MKNISFLSENFQFLEVKFSIYLNRHVFVMVLSNCRSRCHMFESQLSHINLVEIDHEIILQ